MEGVHGLSHAILLTHFVSHDLGSRLGTGCQAIPDGVGKVLGVELSLWDGRRACAGSVNHGAPKGLTSQR